MTHTNFNVQQDGFHFVNSFDNYRFFGPIEVNIGGRCGGMAYSSLDYYNSHMPIPPQSELPTEGSALSTYISGRQERSVLNEIDKWVELTTNPFGVRNSEFFHWGLQETASGSLGQLIQEIDAGRPAVLGLFHISGDPGNHHQVVAVGYERTSGESPVNIFVYDPNHPEQEKILQAHPAELQYYYPDFLPDERWLTYFVDLSYRMRTPPSQGELTGCSGIDYSNRDLHGLNLSNSNYRCANCRSTNFTGCTINQADFGLANLMSANFYGANLRNSNFSGAFLVSANFYGADLKVTQFISADAGHSTFRGADVKLADFSNAILNSCDFYGADLARAILDNAICDNASFYGASLNSTSLVYARFHGAILIGADLRNANATRADFSYANLTGADLTGANRTDANFTGANLTGTHGI
jgi:uncharacterized protein YjbI with pentapeptide repeats